MVLPATFSPSRKEMMMVGNSSGHVKFLFPLSLFFLGQAVVLLGDCIVILWVSNGADNADVPC